MNYETREFYELEMDAEMIEKKFVEFLKIYENLQKQEKTVSTESGRNLTLIMVDFAKTEKISEILDKNGKPILLPESDVKTSGVPSVTRILAGSKSPFSAELLERWKAKMIRELGLKGFTGMDPIFFRQYSKF